MVRLRRQIQDLSKRMVALEASALTVDPDEPEPPPVEPEPDPEEKP